MERLPLLPPCRVSGLDVLHGQGLGGHGSRWEVNQVKLCTYPYVFNYMYVYMYDAFYRPWRHGMAWRGGEEREAE